MANAPQTRSSSRRGNQNNNAGTQQLATQDDYQDPRTKGRPGRKSILEHMATRLNMDANGLQKVLRDTVFQKASDSEFAALLVVAEAYKLNPLTKEIYAFPNKGGGIVPLVSIDGWIRIINDHPQMAGIAWEDIADDDGKLVAIECTIWRKDRPDRPIKVIEYLSECIQGTEPWRKMPARMLRHKSTIQAARYAFGFSGIYDESDAAVIEGGVLRSDSDEAPPTRTKVLERRPSYDTTADARPAGEPSGETSNDGGENYDTGSGEVILEQPGAPAAEDTDATPPHHPSWKKAAEITDEAAEKENIMDLNSLRSRTLADIEAMPEDVQAVVHAKLDEIEKKLKGGRN